MIRCFGQILGATFAAQKVCYGKYGCFSNDPPFDRGYWLDYLPESPETIGTTFYLHTRKDRIGFKLLDDSDVSKLKASDYDGNKKTMFIIHGWKGTYILERIWE